MSFVSLMRNYLGATVVVSLTVGLTLTACRKDGPAPDDSAPAAEGRGAHPWLMATPDDRQIVLDRLDREPYLTVYAKLVEQAEDDWREPADPAVWDHGANGHNGEVAFANAFLAWLEQDPARADKAREGFDRLPVDYETHETFDINIRMPHTLMGYTDAWDLLSATPWFPEAEADAAREKITTINRKFFAQYLEDDFYRGVWLAPSQNNHPIRTAAAIGYVALAFPDDPDAEKWANWAVSELDYLWGPDGQYVQPDGGVSEGPFYYGFAWGVSTAFFIAADHVVPADREFLRDCRNRNDLDPWTGHGCVDGEAFAFENPLRLDRYQDTVRWSMGLRLPDGNRPPLADAYFNPFNGAALLTSFGGEGSFTWDWQTNVLRPYEMGHGADLVAHHLVYVDDGVSPREPDTITDIRPEAGTAVLRSDWGTDARWLLLVGEHGSARKTLHDHVDGTSFSMAAYGEYLLVDPGYYKPNDLNNAVTSADDAHNVLLIDGQAAPDKGLLTNFGDTDAFLEHGRDGERFDYVEAHQTYQNTDVQRSVVLVADRFYVVADRLESDTDMVREYQWRLNGYAGYGSGERFEVRADGATWERTLAGVDVYLGATQAGLAVEEPAYVENEPPHVHLFELDRSLGEHGVIDGRLTGSQPGFLAVLAPYKVGAVGADGPMTVDPIPTLGPGAVGWTVGVAGQTWVVVLRESGSPADLDVGAGRTVSTDAELAIVEVGGDAALIARGTTLSVDGVSRISGAGTPVASTEW